MQRVSEHLVVSQVRKGQWFWEVLQQPELGCLLKLPVELDMTLALS